MSDYDLYSIGLESECELDIRGHCLQSMYCPYFSNLEIYNSVDQFGSICLKHLLHIVELVKQMVEIQVFCLINQVHSH
jgi:hypothetical protein